MVGANSKPSRRPCLPSDFRSEATGTEDRSGERLRVRPFRVLPRRVEEGRAFGSSTIWEALAQPICNVGLDEPFVPTTLEDTLMCEALCFFLSFWKGWNGRVD